MAKRMTRMAAAAVAATCLTCLILAGCASRGPDSRAARDQADKTAPITKASSGIMRYKIRDWSVLDDHTLILAAQDGTKYRAETLGPCPGLGFATRVGFVNRGGFNQIDRTSSVVLEDGTRCQFQSFDEIRSAESKALDSYERAAEAPPPKQE